MSGLEALAFAVTIAWASYRVWALIALDTLTIGIRRRIFTEVDESRRVRKWLKLWLKCPWCAGAWVTIAVTVATDVIVDGGIPAPVLVGAAACAGTALLGGNDDRMMEGDEALGYSPEETTGADEE